MSKILRSAREFTKAHEGLYFRYDGMFDNLSRPAKKSQCYRIHRVWEDGFNSKKYGIPIPIRPTFTAFTRSHSSVEIFTLDEFEKLPE